MDRFKKLILKTCLLVLLLLAMHFFYVGFFYEADLQRYSPMINLVRAVPDTADILYVAESSNNHTRYNDADKRKISSFLADLYPELCVAEITQPAAHPGIYKVLLNNVPKESRIKTLVITLNLRAFNAQWIYSDLETALQKEMVLLRQFPPLINRFLLSFKAYDIKTPEEREEQIHHKWENDRLFFPYDFPCKNIIEWDRYIVENGINNENSTRSARKTELATHYVKAYAFRIDTLKNPRIKDLNKIIKIAQKRKWNLVFNLLAENTDKANELLGKDLLYLMEENRKLLVDYFTRRGVVVVDNFYAVDDREFVDVNWTTEHYAERGRRIIASNVADSLQKFYPDAYIEVYTFLQVDTLYFYSYNEIKTFQFIDEVEEFWTNVSTLTREKSYSGEYSSRTGKDFPYSLTFKYPLCKLPDTLKNKLMVHIKILQQSDQHDAKLVIQTEGTSEATYWEGLTLQEQVSESGTWKEVGYSYYFSPQTKEADTLKIYVYNPSDVLVYVDDFIIEME